MLMQWWPVYVHFPGLLCRLLIVDFQLVTFRCSCSDGLGTGLSHSMAVAAAVCVNVKCKCIAAVSDEGEQASLVACTADLVLSIQEWDQHNQCCNTAVSYEGETGACYFIFDLALLQCWTCTHASKVQSGRRHCTCLAHCTCIAHAFRQKTLHMQPSCVQAEATAACHQGNI